MPTLTAARHIRYDPRTDTRDYLSGPETEEGLAELNHCLATGDARLEAGLRGWGEYTHTLHSETWGAYHVALEESS